MVTSDNELRADLGGLLLSSSTSPDLQNVQRALRWKESLARLGITVPLWLVFDIGSASSRANVETALDPPTAPPPDVLGPAESRAYLRWRALLQQLARTELFEQRGQWEQRDELVVAVLFRLFSAAGRTLFPLAPGTGGHPGQGTEHPLELEHELRSIPQLFEAFPRGADLELLRGLGAAGPRLLVAASLIRPEVLKLFGIFGAEARRLGALDFVDILGALESDESGEVARFSFDLLPSLLETRRASGRQAFAMDGYDGMERHGPIDSMVMTELALDDELFQQRFLEGSLTYFTHAKRREEEGPLHYLCLDASASMRGPRSVFARGLALALLKRISLAGEDAYLRFFDSRLYPPQATRRGHDAHGGINLAQVMTFRGERGRNYAKVFAELTMELAKLARRDPRKPHVYILTHAQCHVPTDIIERLHRHATLFGIFMQPSRGELDLDYLTHLDSVQVVNDESLGRRDERAKSALQIVETAASATSGQRAEAGASRARV